MMSANASRRRWLFAATFVLLLAATLRLVALPDVPPGLAQDEVLNADIVENIRGGEHAFFFREGFGHEPLYHYWSVPFQVLLGDNVLAARMPAFSLGLLLIAAVMRWLRRDAGPLAALISGGLLALSWWPIIFSRVGLRPILEPLLLVGMAWYWRKHPVLAGIFLGLTLYSYTAARVMPLLPLLFLLYLALRHASRRHKPLPEAAAPSWRRLWRQPLVIFAVTMLLALPLILALRADPTLDERARQLSGPLAALRQGDWGPIWATTRATLGVFAFTGDPRWTYSLPNRPLFDPLTALFFVGGLGLTLWRWRRPFYGLVLLWLGLALIPSAVTPDAPSTVRLIGALPVVYALPAFVLQELFSRSQKQTPTKTVQYTITTITGILLLINGGRTLADGFGRWPVAVETREKYQTVLYEMARYWAAGPPTALVVADDRVDPIDADSLRRNLGRDAAARWVQGGRALVFPAEMPAQLFAPEFAPPLPDLLTLAGVAQPLYRSPNHPSFAVWELPPPPPASAPPATFEGRLTFLGSQWLPDGPPRLLTMWRVEQALPADLAIFAHLLDADGVLVAQHDGFDAFAPSLRAGDVVWQWHVFEMPASTPPPRTLSLGLYTRDNLTRLTYPGQPADQLLIPLPANFDGSGDDR